MRAIVRMKMVRKWSGQRKRDTFSSQKEKAMEVRMKANVVMRSAATDDEGVVLMMTGS